MTRMLIVDRDPVIRATQCAFRMHGYDAVVASSIAEALILVHTHCPRAIVLDWSPRSGAGPGAARLLRETIARDVVIVALSALDEPDGIRASETFDDYFTKPTPVADLARRIGELLEARSA